MAPGYFMLAIQRRQHAALDVARASSSSAMAFSNPTSRRLLGNLYNTEELKPKKDSAYNIFYMGINIGAFICNFVAAYLRNNYGWGYAFAAAGFGMVLGVVSFISGMRMSRRPTSSSRCRRATRRSSDRALCLSCRRLVAGGIGWIMPRKLFGHALPGSNSNDASSSPASPSSSSTFTFWCRRRASSKPSHQHAADHVRRRRFSFGTSTTRTRPR